MARGSVTGRAAARAGLIAAFALAGAAACTRSEPGGATGATGGAASPAGRRVAGTDARTLAASPDGAWLAYREGCREARGQFLPPGTASCDLRVVPSAGGEAVKVGVAVTTLPHAVAWHPAAPLLAFLGDYDYVAGTGKLQLSSAGAGPTVVADGVGFFGFVPGAGAPRVAALSGGKLLLAGAGQDAAAVPGAEGLTSFELNPGPGAEGPGVAALLRRPARTGGALLAQGRDGKVRELAASAGDYAFAAGGGAYAFGVQGKEGYDLQVVVGAGGPRLAGRAVRSFAFSPDGKALAFVEGARPGKQGDSRAGPVGGPWELLGKDVGEFGWARGAERLAWLEAYDARVRSGTAAAGGPGAPRRAFGKSVTDLELSPDGRWVAYVQHTSRGGYSVDSWVAPVDGAAPAAQVATGVFGFSFSPDSRWLYYRTRCVRNAEACDLERVPSAGRDAGKAPDVLAQGLKSFEFDARDPDRLLLGWQRMDRAALDVGVLEHGKLVRVDTLVQPGTAMLLGPDSRRLAYVVVDPKRAGVWVADLAAAAAAAR
ncbi:MAG: hypothetical protein QM704_15295 [Anaeromyxobacteraceae bacterium]